MKNTTGKFNLRTLLLLLFFAAPCLVSAKSGDWQKIKTPHFEIVFDAKHKEIARAYAVRAEKAYELLWPIFKEAPANTIIMINDSTDLANGYATRVPYPFIMVYPVLPGSLETISEYGDWALELIIHEYTHILSFEPAHAGYDYLRPIFGNIIAPNMLMPRWWLEGLAVEMETRLSGFGRLRSYHQEAALRALVLDQKLSKHTIDQINEVGIPSWPYGGRPYLFGSLLWSDMVALGKPEVVEKLTQAQGRRVPYLIDTPVVNNLGNYYPELFELMKIDLKKRVDGQMAKITNPQKLDGVTLKGIENQLPTISPDGLKMVFLSKSEVGQRTIEFVQRKAKDKVFHLEDEDQSIWIRSLPDDTPTLKPDVPPGGNVTRVSWFPDSDQIVFDKAQSLRREIITSDLFIYDFNTKKNKRLTTGLRLREPAVDATGKNLVFVQIEAGRTSLAMCPLNCEIITSLYVPPMHSKISFPSFLNDREILFSLRDPTGKETLHLYNLETKTVRGVLPDYPEARFAKVTQRGILFSSSKSGILDLYWSDLNFTKVTPATRVMTGAFTADWDSARQELYLTTMTGEGMQIRKTASLPENTAPQQKVSGLYEDRYPALKKEQPTELLPEEQALASFTEASYSPWYDLAPKYWIPFFYSTENGVFFQAMTSGQDATQSHAYSLQVGYDSFLERGSFAFSYLNRQTPTYVSLGYVQTQQSLLGGDIVEEKAASVVANRELSWISPEASYGVGWIWRNRTIVGGATEKLRSGPLVNVGYSDVTQSDAQISPESGKSFSLSGIEFLKSQTSSAYRQLNASTSYYWSRWLPKRHALGLKAQGLYTDGLIAAIDGGSSNGAPISSDLVVGDYLMRGYMSGQFLGKNLLNANLEYRFPLVSIYKGFGVSPLFMKRISGNIFVDQLWMEGFYYEQDTRRYLRSHSGEPFTGAGAEVRLDTNVGYNLPISLILGAYTALSRPTEGDTRFFIGLSL